MKGDEKKPNEALIAEIFELRQRLEGTDDPVWQALRESEERYRIVTEISRDVIVVTDKAGRWIYLNPAMQDVYGYDPSDYLGMPNDPAFGFVHPDDRDRIKKEFESIKQAGDTVYYSPYRYRHQEGHWIWIEAIGTSYLNADGEFRLLEVSHDITEQVEEEQRKQLLSEQMKESQRLESLGVLAGGIAHDFNNLLTSMLGDASLAMLDMPRDSPVRLRLQRIQKAAHRATALTNQMLAYSGQKPAVIELLDVSQLVKEMAQLLEGAVSGKAVLVYDLIEDLPMVEGDAAQLSQVVMNLVTNATEAIREGAGQAVLRTGLVESDQLEKPFLFGSDALASGSYVFIEVVDNGCGMDAEARSKVFDPFFTTKFTGRGLGLAAALGIVRSHGGVIELESEVGKGTRFRVLFPSRGRRVIAAAQKDISIEEWRGRGTVLVADDDEGVRALVKETLQRAGMTVLVASDGREAVEVFRRQPDEIQIVVLDRTMPSLGGEEAFDEIRRIRSDAPIILVSGYSEERVAWHFIHRGLDAFLPKPFEPMALVERVRRILEARKSPNGSD